MGLVQRWLSEPPPDRVFEITEYALAEVSSRNPNQLHQEQFVERGLAASPNLPNLLKPQLYREAVARVASRDRVKRMAGALVIPDYAVRMTILDFEEFPNGETERLALLRFRLRKSVPFPIDEAQLAYAVQFEQPSRIEVLTVAVARPILQEYEAIFQDAGYQIGLVIPSSIAVLPLCEVGQKGMTLLAKSAGSIVSVVLAEEGRVRLVRCLDLEEEAQAPVRGREESVLPLVQQTLAFAEDQLGQKVNRGILCGFEQDTEALRTQMQKEFGIPFSQLRSRYGLALKGNAGVLGLLEQYAA